MSLPVWEEWIEIRVKYTAANPSKRSLPVWEEWIEIGTGAGQADKAPGLFPYGKSGLKWLRRERAKADCRLFPYGKSGLKLHPGASGDIRRRLFPYGKSGLKCVPLEIDRTDGASLPVWEEWIEIPRRENRN